MTSKAKNAKWFVATLAAGVLALAACTSGQASSTSTSPAAAASASGGAGSPGTAQAGTSGLPAGLSYSDARATALGVLKGKKVVYIPIGGGVPLTDSWKEDLQATFDSVGMTMTVKDPAFDAQKQLQDVEAAIAEKPDVIIVHNADAQLNAKLLQQAMDQGIYVIQMNLQSSTVTDAYVGADFVAEGNRLGELTAEKCAGKDIAFMHNGANLTSDIQQSQGFMEVAKAKGMNIVAEQDGAIDRAKNASIAATIIKQYPNICAIAGLYDEAMIGAATAVEQAGLKGKMLVFTTVAGDAGCTGVRDGLFAAANGSNGRRVGIVTGGITQQLLESGLKPGSQRYYIFTPHYDVTKDNYAAPNICFTVTK